MATPGGPAYTGGYAPQPKVRFETLGEAWRILQSNIGTWVGATVIMLVCVVGLNLVLRIIAGHSMGAQGVATVGSWIISFFFQCGMARMAVRQVRGEQVQVGDLFSVTDVIGAVALGAVLYSLLTMIGFVLCILPGIILSGLLLLMPFLIADQRMDAAAALSSSMNAMKTDLLMAVLFIFVAGIIVLVSAIPCGLGTLVTIPMVFVAEALIYRDFFPAAGGYSGGPGAYAPPYAPAATVEPTPPAAPPAASVEPTAPVAPVEPVPPAEPVVEPPAEPPAQP
jgi:hypothetical protein